MARESGKKSEEKRSADNSEAILDKASIQSVVRHLKEYYQLDLQGYADASLARRVDHVVKIFGLESVDQLLSKIREEPDFKLSLVHEITVGATEMFRDPTFWTNVKSTVLPNFKNRPFKIWIAGCSTGEEIFSLAICLKETGMFDQAEILASDLDAMKIDVARKGFYLNTTFVKNSENYINSRGTKTLEYYCKRGAMGYEMNLDLIQKVVFRHHDLIQDTMDEKFDIIFCRNVMIYFNQEFQNNVLNKLRSSLLPNGYLGLGLKESITWLKDSRFFTPVKRLEKIYQLKDDSQED